MSDRGAIEGVAADWVMRRRDPDWSSEDEVALSTWLDEAVSHRAAFWRLQYGDELSDCLKALGSTENQAATVRERRPQQNWRSYVASAGAAAAAIATLCVLALNPAVPAQSETTEYHTSFGQLAHVTLSDGSVLDLDTDTRVRVQFDDRRRRLWLDRGQVFINVAKDRNRPFVTMAGLASITDLGTAFSVSRHREHTAVAVVEGEVRIQPSHRPDEPGSVVTAGARAETDGRSTLVTLADAQAIADAMAWRNGAVIFRNTRLADAAAYFNRYNRRRLEVDHSVADLRIGGAFQLGNVVGFTRLLAAAYGIQVQATPGAIKISR